MNKLLVKRISGILEKDKNIALAYLFGSSAKGRAKTNDVDIAVLLKKDVRGMKKLEYINTLSSKVEKETKRPADIVIFNHASVALKQQVLKYGKPLFEKEKGLISKLKVKTITDYLDYLNILNFFLSKTARKGA